MSNGARKGQKGRGRVSAGEEGRRLGKQPQSEEQTGPCLNTSTRHSGMIYSPEVIKSHPVQGGLISPHRPEQARARFWDRW